MMMVILCVIYVEFPFISVFYMYYYIYKMLECLLEDALVR